MSKNPGQIHTQEQQTVADNLEQVNACVKNESVDRLMGPCLYDDDCKPAQIGNFSESMFFLVCT